MPICVHGGRLGGSVSQEAPETSTVCKGQSPQFALPATPASGLKCNEIHMAMILWAESIVCRGCLQEGKRQEAIGSRKAYTDYLRDLKKLDELAQKANRQLAALLVSGRSVSS